MAAKKPATEYIVSGNDHVEAKTYKTKDSATKLADKRAEEWGDIFKVTTSKGKLVHTAYPQVEEDSTDLEPEVISEGEEPQVDTLDELGEEPQDADDEPQGRKAPCGCYIEELILNGAHADDCVTMQPDESDLAELAAEDAEEAPEEPEQPQAVEPAAELEIAPEQAEETVEEEPAAEPSTELVLMSDVEAAKAHLPEITEPEAAEEEPEAVDEVTGVKPADAIRDYTMLQLHTLMESTDDPRWAKAARDEWAARQRRYGARLSGKKDVIPGPLMTVYLEVGVSRPDGSLMSGIDGRSRNALIKRGWAQAEYKVENGKRKMVRCTVTDSGRKAIWK